MNKIVILLLALLIVIATNEMLPAQAVVTHTPCVGAVTSSSARISVRTDVAASVQIKINGQTTPAVTTQADRDFFVIIDLANLQPNTVYNYVPVVDGVEQSAFAGSFKTFPTPGETSNFSFLFGSGQQAVYDDPNSGFGNIFPIMANEDALFFLHQGDWGYPDTTDSEQGDSLNFFAKHLDLIYQSYESRFDPGYPMSEMLKVFPVDYVWDDHDWVNNNCDVTYMSQGGSNSIQVYQEVFPSYPLASASRGLWHKFSCGNVDIFMVDNRAQRDPNSHALYWHPTLNRYVFVANYQDNHTILGEEQMNWLIDELKASTADWKIISSGTPFNPATRGLIELALLLQGTQYDPLTDPATGAKLSMAYLAEEFSDKWSGFPASVYKLLKGIIDSSIENVIFISGDTHNSGIDDGTNSLIPELMGGPLDRTNQQIVAMSKHAFYVDIWNKGGHTYDNAIPPDLGNAYGKVTIFGSDSVRLEVVSEKQNVLASHTVKPGYIPRRVAGMVVPGGIDFGTVPLGSQGGSAVVAVSTSIDSFKISDIIVLGTTQIVPLEKTAALASGESKILQFGFIPSGNVGDTVKALISIACNDPTGFKILGAQGVIGAPTGVDSDDDSRVPVAFQLYPNYPNPFNASTTIRFAVPKFANVEISIYNSMGQLVRQLVKKDFPAGTHRLQWDGTNGFHESVATGLYFVTLKTDHFYQTRKILFLK